jgi:transposase
VAAALSVDLRERVVAAIEAGALRREAARRFEVSPASAVRCHGTFVQEGRREAKPMGCDQCSHTIESQADLIRQTYETSESVYYCYRCGFWLPLALSASP